MSHVLSALLVLFAIGFLFAGLAEFVARKARNQFRNRLLYWMQMGLLAVPIYVHGLHGNEAISVFSGILFAVIGVVEFVMAIVRVRKSM